MKCRGHNRITNGCQECALDREKARADELENVLRDFALHVAVPIAVLSRDDGVNLALRSELIGAEKMLLTRVANLISRKETP